MANCRACKERLIVSFVALAGVSGLLWQSRADLASVRAQVTAYEARVQRLETDLAARDRELALRAETLDRVQARTDDLIERLLDVRFGPVSVPAKAPAVPKIPESLRKLAGLSRPPQVSRPSQKRGGQVFRGKAAKAGPDEAPGRKDSAPTGGGKTVFQALGVRGDRLYYRAFDGQVHVARPGDLLHGIDGQYRGYDPQRRVAVLRLGKRVLELKPGEQT